MAALARTTNSTVEPHKEVTASRELPELERLGAIFSKASFFSDRRYTSLPTKSAPPAQKCTSIRIKPKSASA
jgi:hypothetical protein